MTSEGNVECYLVGRRQGDNLTLLSGVSGSATHEGRTVLVFGDPSAAEVFRVMEGLGPDWEVFGHRLLEVIQLLRASAANGIGYVEIEPPSRLTRGEETPQLVLVRDFMDYLLSE